MTASAEAPRCEDESKARTSGYKIASDTSDTVYWCFGYDQTLAGSTRVLKVVNNRRYPLMVEHPNLAVLRNRYQWFALSNLTRVDKRFAIIEPRGTATFNADLAPGASEGIATQVDALGQNLYALQVGVETLLTILTRFGVGSDSKKIDILNKLLSIPKCLSSIGQGSGALVANCFDAKTIIESFGPVGLILAPLAAAGGLATFFVAQAQGIKDIVTGNDRYAVQIRRAAPAFGGFEGTWVAHTAQVEIDASGHAREHIGSGCCDPIITVEYQLTNPHPVNGGWVADARVTKVVMHDWSGRRTPPLVGRTYPVRIADDHFYGVAVPGFGFCSESMDLDEWDCGA